MKAEKITEEKFIDFAYRKATFSKQILLPFIEVLDLLKRQGQILVSKSFESKQIVKFQEIKGSLEEWPPNERTGKSWLDIVANQEKHCLREDIKSLFDYMALNPKNFKVYNATANITLININNTYFIKDGHKRVALTRYLYEMKGFQPYLSDVNIINCNFMN